MNHCWKLAVVSAFTLLAPVAAHAEEFNGYDAMSVVAVAADAGTTRQAVYRRWPTKADLALWQGILISAASLSIGWLVYDFLCKSPLGDQPTVLYVSQSMTSLWVPAGSAWATVL